MQTLLTRIGYNKGEKLRFLNKRVCGLWLIWIGAVIVLGTATGGKYWINPAIFVIGYCSGMYLILGNKKVRRRFGFGKGSTFQKKVSNFSIIFMFLLMSIFSGRYFGVQNYRMIWLGALLATGIHFVPFSLVHGKLLLVLAVILSIAAIIGMNCPDISFWYFGVIDGIIKIVFGIIFFMSRKPLEV